MKKKYTAFIDCFDNDYRAYVGCEEHQVDSLEEAKAIAEEETWRGHTYIVDKLLDNETRKFIN